jgi:hypothetical protein
MAKPRKYTPHYTATTMRSRIIAMLRRMKPPKGMRPLFCMGYEDAIRAAIQKVSTTDERAARRKGGL